MPIEPWMITATANAIMVFIYALIAIGMIRAIIEGRQLLTNPLLTATAAIFVTCTLGHGDHLEHVLFSAMGAYGPATAVAAKAEFGDLRLVWWDAFTAVVAIYFYTLRSRFAIVYKGAALCEDMEKREKQALELHDNVVQGLAQAKLALDLGRRQEGYDAVEATLVASQRIMTGLLGAEGTELALGPGDMRRKAAAGTPR